MASTVERKGTFKVEFLREIEKQVQKRWYDEKVYEVDAPKGNERDEDEKFFTTFPFPYMNGRLHLGHTFSLSKCEFAARYHRLKGKRVLFPFAFHCTGMPIKACADKLEREMEMFGYPPKFPDDETVFTVTIKKEDELLKDKSKGKKSKAIAKAGNAKYQWQIMRSLGMTDEAIKQFADASHWLDHFPPLAVQDLRSIGIHVDWRRTFITTEANPYFDSFVRWHFNKLRAHHKVKYGKRYTIFSPKDNQPCMDHDRATGEGVGSQEYTLVKLKLLAPFPAVLKSVESRSVYLVAATLRPETMYGQTNCWVHPEMRYVAFETKTGDVFICTRRAARNMAYQEFTKTTGSYDVVEEFSGEKILGAALSAPFSFYSRIYTLPMLTIRGDKGTGVVTSVPSDSPDDFAALADLKKKAALREKYSLTDDMVLPFEPVPIINVPGFGSLSAVVACERLRVNSQNDREKLIEAKEMVYLKGFYDGVMEVGEFKGRKVQEIKKELQKQMLDTNQAVLYHEPDKLIISRSGDECVVALCDQWYLDYGEEKWKKKAMECLERMNTYHEEVRKNFIACFNWLHEYACSRTYGLGTKLPWDEQWLIESLSDSTIYNAYYTVSHLLQNGTFKGENSIKNGIRPEYLTCEVWDYVFMKNAPYPDNCKLPKKLVDTMRKEFHYWYPVDLRCSGKDLIQNHLTFYIYNHCAVWPDEEDKWPKGIRANGHLLLNAAKMSKSEGNFLTLAEAVQKFSADGMRLCLAYSGDSIEDANFAEATADAGILRLYTFIEWVKEMKANESSLRSGSFNFDDKVFISEMNLKNEQTDKHYNLMLFKEAVRTGFFELQTARDKYRERTSCEDGMHADLVFRFIGLQALLLSPVCPHVSEYIWQLLGNKDSILKEKWPVAGPVDSTLIEASEYVAKTVHSFRIQRSKYTELRKTKEKKSEEEAKPYSAQIFIAKTYPPWKSIILTELLQLYEKDNKLPENKALAAIFKTVPGLERHQKKVMPFVQVVREGFEVEGINALKQNRSYDEYEILNRYLSYLKNTLEVEEVTLKHTDNADASLGKIKEDICPGSPHILFGGDDRRPVFLKLVNNIPQNGFFSVSLNVIQLDRVDKIIDKIRRDLKLTKDKKVEIWRFKNPTYDLRKIPSFDEPFADKEKLEKDDEFVVDEKFVIHVKRHDGTKKLIGDTAVYVIVS